MSSRPDWKELADDDGYEDGSFMVIGKVGPNENIVDEHEGENVILEQSVESAQSAETPSPCELHPEEVRKIMEAPTSFPASVPDVANSTVSLAESLTPSFVTGDNPSLTTNGSSLSNSSTEAIFDNATNQVAHLTEENQVLKSELEKNRELTKRNIETWREFEASAAKQHQADKEKHEESRQLVLKLREEKEQLKSRILVLEGQMKIQGEMDSLNLTGSTIAKDELKSLEAKLCVKEDSLRRLKTLLEENEALLNEEKYQTELLKKLLREQEVKVAEVQPAMNADTTMMKEELEKEREQNELVLEKLRKELDWTKNAFEETLLKKDAQIETLKKEIEDLHLKLENLSDYNQTLGKNSESARNAILRLEHQLRESQNENILLTTRVAAMKAENEQVENLKQEMEAFRLDYLTERENRSKVEDEKALMLLQLSSLKEELKINREELDNLHKTHLTFATEHVNRDDEIISADAQAPSGSRVSNLEPYQADVTIKSDYEALVKSRQRAVEEKEDALRYIEKLESKLRSKETKIKDLQDAYFEAFLKRRDASANFESDNVSSRLQMREINSGDIVEDTPSLSNSSEVLRLRYSAEPEKHTPDF